MAANSTLIFFVTLRSPYSYLAVDRVAQLVERSDVELDFRPVYPLAIRNKDFFKNGNRALLSYLRRDAERVAQMNKINFIWPDPDPVLQDLKTAEIETMQPYIFHVTRLCAAACAMGKGFNFYRSVSALLFSGVQHWHQRVYLADAAARAGLSFDELEKQVLADPDELDSILERNAELQASVGHWGTPLLHVAGETFFGQDRIEMCAWHMAEQGLISEPMGT